MSELSPFVKWAGGKRQLLEKIQERMPEKYNNYYEPFVGGGAVLFALQPEKAVINDVNAALVNTYKTISENPEEFIAAVKKIDNIPEDGRSYYYSLRNQYNEKMIRKELDTELAALFVFLNKHCFNGLYRVNKEGLFNVPYNNSKRKSIDEDSVRQISEYLKKVKILQGDFEEALRDANEGDFIFFDSPYAPLNSASFEAYTKEGFGTKEHIRLAKLFDKLTNQGCFCMLTNHNTNFIKDLYGNKGYRMDVIDVKRMINSDAKKRTGEEIIICNY